MILGHLRAEATSDLSVSQLFHRLLDDGIFIASLSSWQRIARAHKLTGDRRRQATHPAKAVPELCAVRANQAWSWDITVLPSVDRGRNFRLYVILDVFSRFVVGWRLEDRERDFLAVEMLKDTVHGQEQQPEVLHADRGSPMTSKMMTGYLEEHNIIQSHSRPRVSNDNPFSESQFKTMKYDLDYPGKFTSLNHARQWVSRFIRRYNTAHRHSGIGYYTPASVHDGTWMQARAQRQTLLDANYAKHPHRYRNPPKAHEIEMETWINKPEMKQAS